MLASLVGFLGDFDLAEEATADAFATAAELWTGQAVPPNPGGWLTTTAKRRAIDLIRRRRTLAEKSQQLKVSEATDRPSRILVWGARALRSWASG